MKETEKTIVPKSLRVWFLVHFIADVIFAVPLMFFPESFLSLLEWKTIDPFTARLVAAALFGIGIESLLAYNADAKAFKAMLNLKIIWSATASLGILMSMLDGKSTESVYGWVILCIFVCFNFLWSYWRIKIGRMLKMV